MEKFVFFLLLAFLFTTGFQNEKPISRAALIQEALAKKEVEYRQIQQKRCRDNALEAANLLVDSLIRAQSRLRLDTLSRPPKPQKPLPPDLLIPMEDDSVAPFLNKLDTLF